MGLFMVLLLGSFNVVPDDRVVTLAFSDDSKQLVSGSYFSGDIGLWDVRTKKKVAKTNVAKHYVASAALVGDKILVSTMGPYTEDAGHAHGKVLLFNKALREPKEFQGHMAAAAGGNDVLFVAEGKQWVGDGRVLRIKDGKDEVLLDDLPGNVCCLRLSPDRKVLAVGTLGNSATLVDLATKKALELNVAYRGSYNCLAFAGPDLAVIDSSSWLTLWSPEGKLKDTKAIEAKGFCVAADTKDVVVGTATGDLLIWSLGDGRQTARTIKNAHQGIVYAVALSPDGKSIASGGEDGQVVFHAR